MLIIGHRGARGLAPENTLAALEAGLKAHANMLEIDVRVSADGFAVLNHDPFIQGDDGKKIFIDKANFTDLQLAKQNLLTFEAALQFIDRHTDVIIEIKPGVDLGPIIDCIKHRLVKNWLESDFVIASFDFNILKQIHKDFPNIHLAVLEKWSGVRASRRAKELGTNRLIMNERWLWSGFIRAVSKRGFKLSAYTLNNVKKARRFEKHGLYGCITDFPDRFNTKS